MGLILVGLVVLPFIIRSGRAARWSVDLEGLASPTIGRISFSDVASLHLGYPRTESPSISAVKFAVSSGARPLVDQALVLRLADGRLLPLNLLSPTIRGGAEVMTKLMELLAGKTHSTVFFSTQEIAAFKRRPMNRIVVPKK